MEKFVNQTNSLDEKAIKIGSSVPSDAAVIGWFNSDEVTPSNSVSILDVSNQIPENNIPTTNINEPIIAYADELGFLKTLDNKYSFPTNNLTIGNTFISKSTNTEQMAENDLNSKDFVHYYYISKYFISAPSGFSLISRKQFLSPERIKSLNIKVVTENGKDYIDEVLNIKKYRILLEPFITDDNENNPEKPHRIIVLLDHSNPINLKLVYDKIETNTSGQILNQEIQYSETINAVPFFSEVPEESFVIDDNYYQENNYSIKKINQKYSDLFSTNPTDTGYQITVPTKAIGDYRIFEVFNWRLIGRSRVSVNRDEVNYDINLEIDKYTATYTVAAGVLHVDEEVNENINPYIFYRLAQSPFNLSKYQFVNPKHIGSGDITTANYWKVNIDTIDTLNDFDILIWSPKSTITTNQKAKIDAFIANNGTIILDLSAATANAENIDQRLTINRAGTISNYIDTINDSVVIDFRKNGGWTILDDANNSIFEKSYYGIFGANYIPSRNAYKTYPFFNSSGTAEVFCKAGLDQSTSKPIGIVLQFANITDSLSKGNIVATTFPLSQYCNSIYNQASPEQAITNYGNTVNDPGAGSAYSGIVEGPFKFLYNCVSYALYCKKTTGVQDVRSTLFNFVSPWESSWAMDGNALLPDERDRYFTKLTIGSSSEVYARDILGSHPTVFDYYKFYIAQTLPESQRSILSTLSPTNIEIFIEITNPDIIISNSNKVDEEDFASNENIPSSYYLYKISNISAKALAYADPAKSSPKLKAPTNMGPYIIRDKPISSSSNRRLNNDLNVLNSFKNYPFNLTSSYNYFQGRDKPQELNANYTTELDVYLEGKMDVEILIRPGIPAIDAVPSREISNINGNCSNFKSSIDDLGHLRATRSNSNNNIFPYTGDIDIHRDPRIWKNLGPSIQTIEFPIDPEALIERYTWLSRIIYVETDGFCYRKHITIYTNKTIVTVLYKASRKRKFETESVTEYINKLADSDFANGGLLIQKVYNTTIDEALALWNAGIAQSGASIPSPYTTSGSMWFERYGAIEYSAQDVLLKYNKFIEIQQEVQETTIEVQIPVANTNSPHEYVKYIQYTLGVAEVYSKAIDGIYGAQTEAAVVRFQNAYNLRYRDGTVDSETKWYLAKFWLDMKFGNNQLFENWKAYASEDIKKYIVAAENMGLASLINSNKIYKKTTFSGFTGPNEGADIIWFKVPDDFVKVEKIIISPDNSVNGWRNFYLESYGYSSSETTDIFQTTFFTGLNLSAATSDIEINLSNIPTTTAKYFWVRLVGGSIANFGSAEGFSISSIKAVGSIMSEPTPGTPAIPPVTERFTTDTLPVYARLVIPEIASSISAPNPHSETYTVPRVVEKRNAAYIKHMYWNDPTALTGSVTKYFTGNEQKLGDNTEKTFGNLKITFSQALKRIESLYSCELTSISSGNTTYSIYNNPPLTLTTNAELKKVEIDTSSTFYTLSDVVNVTQNINNYKLKKLDGTILPDSRNFTNVNDGILLICKPDGTPDGLPTGAQILTQVSGTQIFTDEEIDLRYGYFSIRNNITEDNGFIYGFYDINQREFLGKKIHYIDVISRGVANIYIAVCAIDADGNTQNKNEYIGPNVSTVFKPVILPLKIICPVYSVKYNNLSSIRIGNLDPNISKFDAWELPITSGSFWKTINISQSKVWSDWKNNYKGQDIVCLYSSADKIWTNWSNIFGYGHYDIIDESPILLNEKKIKVKRIPILSWNYPTNNRDSKFNIIKQILQVYIRGTINDSWQLVSDFDIRDINCQTGVIEFRKNIVPLNPDLIKISYTTSNKDILIRQVNGNPIPINPFLNFDLIQFDRPLFIYILPKRMYKKINPSSSQNNLTKITDYSYSDYINFTYNKDIFNINSASYDPFALLIGVVYVYNNPYRKSTNIADLRLRGGGVINDVNISELTDTIDGITSFWDVYPPQGNAYAKGGYVIVKIPNEVKNNFNDIKEINQIIENNLTAGVVYEIQDMNGNTWV